ncbi:hypothetical protein FRB90_001731, partial [Tulasnella sp. 427]
MSFNGSYYDPSLLSTDSASERSGRPAGPRRNTGSSVPPPRPLGLPEGRTPPGSAQSSVNGRDRSRSPLRKAVATDDANGRVPDPRGSTRGSIDSSRQSLSDFASSFLKAGTNYLGGAGSASNASGRQSPNRVARKPVPQSPSSVMSRLTDAELEAQALRDKEASRLEAERILTQEAEHRRREDQRVLASLRPTNGSEVSAQSPAGSYSDLPPSNGYATPRKESGNSGAGWMSAIAKKLTPTKDLTPAQQIINDTKAKDKEIEKEQKRSAKDKRKSQPGTPEPKNTDPNYLNLSQIPSRSSPSAYSPVLGGSPSRMSLNTGYSNPGTPTPQRTHGPPGSSPILGPSEPTPLYAVFNPQGTLDIPATVITVAKRFEKLEKWTVSHVRALEERMKDVEKYLIDRESEEKPDPFARKQLEALKKEMTDLQILLLETHSDLTELKNKPPVIHQTTVVQQVAPPAPQRTPSPPPALPKTPVFVAQLMTPPKVSAPLPAEDVETPMIPYMRRTTSSESAHTGRSLPQPPRPASGTPSAFAGRTASNGQVSPNMTGTPPLNNKPSRSRLPYPSGDYTSSGSGFSQPGSPSFSSPGQLRRQTTGGTQPHDRSGSEYSIPERHRSPSPPAAHRQQPSYELSLPRTPSNVNSIGRATSKSPSPTPRKRYTVALSGRDDVPSPNTATRGEGEAQTALFSDSPGGSRAHSLEETGERMVGMFDFSPLVIGKHGKEASDRTDVTATPPSREDTQSPDPTIGGTSITLSRIASPPPTRAMSPPTTRPRSMYSISPSLKTVSSPQTVPTTQTSPRTPSLRARAQSTFSSLDSVSNEVTTNNGYGNGKSPALGAPAQLERQGRPTTVGASRPTHKRAQSQGVGLGINTRDVASADEAGPRSAMPNKRQSTIVTPSGQPFVDPL